MAFLHLAAFLCVLSVGALAQIEKTAPKIVLGSHATIARSKFENVMLKGHNTYRAKHGVAPLTLNRDICNFAQEWADYLAATDHNLPERPDNLYGENLWAAIGDFTPGKSSVDDWYSDIRKYDWNNPGFSMETRYFTQLIWANSTEIGVAKAEGNSGWVYVVANYNPPGNYAGQFEANVPKPIA